MVKKEPIFSVYLLAFVCMGVYGLSTAKTIQTSLYSFYHISTILMVFLAFFAAFLHRDAPLRIQFLIWTGAILYLLFSIVDLIETIFIDDPQLIYLNSSLVELIHYDGLGLYIIHNPIFNIIIFAILLVALALVLEFKTSSLEMSDEPLTPSPLKQNLSSQISRVLRFNSSNIAIDYIRLTKPRLMWLLSLVALSGMAVSSGPSLSLSDVFLTLLGGVLAIGASGTFNHLLESEVDKNMVRTSNRPLATSRINRSNAWFFGIFLTLGSFFIFNLLNFYAAILGLAAIIYYSVVYTLILKPNTVQNTVIGGIAGSFPVIIGSVAVTNTIGLNVIILALIIFFWTPAHFYNLALAYKTDFKNAGLPMFPVVHGDSETKKHIIFYTGSTLILIFLFLINNGFTWFLFCINIIFSTIFLLAIIKLHYNPSRKTAMNSFLASNIYLGMLLLAIIVESLM